MDNTARTWLRFGLWLAPPALLSFAYAHRAEAADPASVSRPAHAPAAYLVYIGTYSGPKSRGIYLSRLETATGRLTPPELAAEIASPSFLALHPSRRFLYAVNEVSKFEGKPSGAVSAFAMDDQTGRLTFLNQGGSGGSGPCHLTVDATGRHVLVANYGGGSVAVLPVQDDGRLGEATAVVQHRGSSVNPQRQERPHAHGIYLDAANRLVLVPDLGLDQVLLYRFDSARGTLEPHDPPAAVVKPGAGPRHWVFHPSGRWGYVINELDSTITAFAYEAGRGRLTEQQTMSTLPPDFHGASTTAEVAVHPSGRFLYGSNRGHDSLAVFGVEAAGGQLRLVQHSPTRGKTPRHFAIDPSGRFLLAANQDSDSVVVFRLDPDTGRLSPSGPTVEVGAPVCLVFVPAP